MEEKKIQDELKESVNKVWLAGLGAMAMAEQEGQKFFKSLVEKGEAYETKSRERFDDVKGKVEEARTKAKAKAESTWEKMEEKFDDAVATAMRRLGVPSREEIATLTKRVEELTAVVEQLRPPVKKAGAAKDAASAAN